MILDNTIVAIGPVGGGAPRGAGFLLTSWHILTCAHVVNACTNSDLYAQQKPASAVAIGFLGTQPDQDATATVQEEAHWVPPLPKGSRAGKPDDMAILTLNKEAPTGAIRTPLRIYSELPSRKFRTRGYPEDWKKGRGRNGVIQGLFEGWKYELVPEDNEGDFVRQGFSGAPVLYRSPASQNEVVIGMVVGARENEGDKTAYMAPLERLKEFVGRVKPNKDIDLDYGIAEDFSHVGLVKEYLQTTVLSVRNGEEFFDLRLKRLDSADDISQLFRQEPVATYEAKAATPAAVLEQAPFARLLMQSPGGAGKSNFLAKLVELAIAGDMVPFVLDGRREMKTSAPWDLENLITDLSVGGGASDFQRAQKDRGAGHVLLLLDRLNEKPMQAKGILDAIRNGARGDANGVRIIVADRVNDRGADISPLTRATLLPLSLVEQEKRLNRSPEPEEAKLLAIPFFLTMYLRQGGQDSRDASMTRVNMFRQFFYAHGDVTPDLLPKLAEAAFDTYETRKSTSIPAEFWRADLKRRGVLEGIVNKIIDGTMLEYVPEGEKGAVVEFRHQLLHDFLAGTHIANSEEKFWRESAFEAASLDEQSYDAIEFAAEQLGSTDGGSKTDAFLTQVYDWNWAAVLECVRNLEAGRHGGKSPVSVDFKDALYCLNVVRKFDRFEHTRSRAISITKGIKPSFDADIVSAASFEELRDQVSKSFQPGGEYLQKWKELFLLKSPPTTVGELDRLWDDPFISWTATNVFRKLWTATDESRRLVLTSEIPSALKSFYRATKSTALETPEGKGARWRIVHLLGVVVDAGTRDFLWSVVIDGSEDKNVRSGAVRSYLEIAIQTADRQERQQMLGNLQNMLKSPQAIPPPVLGQIKSIRPADGFVPEGWHIDCLPVLQEGIRRAKLNGDLEEEKIWTEKMLEIKDLG